jgi:hypothetical protein
MTDITEPLWPAPERRPGSRIRHGWKCSRTGGTKQATRRTPDGDIIRVERCAECGMDDYSERVLMPGPGDAA